MRRLDELHLEHPVYGSRRLEVLLAAGLSSQSQAGEAVVAGDGHRSDLPAGSLSRPGKGTRYSRIC